MSRDASPAHPIHPLIAQRWSPYVFAERSIPPADLASIFEAARWAASSFNEQPWRYIVASRDNCEGFEQILGCLLAGNRVWAQAASALALGCAKTTFSRNGRPNRVALHDLGLASASLTLEATSRGIQVHQMAGILPDAARETFAVPAGFEVVTALALGYAGELGSGAPELRARDAGARTRRPLRDFVFAAMWGQPGL